MSTVWPTSAWLRVFRTWVAVTAAYFLAVHMLVEADHPALLFAPHDAFDAVVGRLLEGITANPQLDVSLERLRRGAGLGALIPDPAESSPTRAVRGMDGHRPERGNGHDRAERSRESSF
jgi:hypothetical protein